MTPKASAIQVWNQLDSLHKARQLAISSLDPDIPGRDSAALFPIRHRRNSLAVFPHEDGRNRVQNKDEVPSPGVLSLFLQAVVSLPDADEGREVAFVFKYEVFIKHGIFRSGSMHARGLLRLRGNTGYLGAAAGLGSGCCGLRSGDTNTHSYSCPDIVIGRTLYIFQIPGRGAPPDLHHQSHRESNSRVRKTVKWKSIFPTETSLCMKRKRSGRSKRGIGRKSWHSFQYTIGKNWKHIFDKKTGLHKKTLHPHKKCNTKFLLYTFHKSDVLHADKLHR